LTRISFAFRSFFSLLFRGALPADIAQAFGYSKTAPVKASTPKVQPGPADGAIQILAILQRDSRLIDFLMEDISGYSDEQVGAAVRDVQSQAKQSLQRYLSLRPLLDFVEGEFVKTEGMDAATLKFVGNVPASGTAPGGLLRHKGWKAEGIDLPRTPIASLVAPAEIEVE
jgi:hypothetical protein